MIQLKVAASYQHLHLVSAMINALEKPENDQNYKYDLTKASEKLAKVLNEAEIRLLMESMVQKDGAEMYVLLWLCHFCHMQPKFPSLLI